MAHDPFKNDALRRALEQAESPLQKAILPADPEAGWVLIRQVRR